MNDRCLTHTTILGDKLCFCFHFIEEETSLSEGKGPRLHSPQETESRSKPRPQHALRAASRAINWASPASLSWGLCVGEPLFRGL